MEVPFLCMKFWTNQYKNEVSPKYMYKNKTLWSQHVFIYLKVLLAGRQCIQQLKTLYTPELLEIIWELFAKKSADILSFCHSFTLSNSRSGGLLLLHNSLHSEPASVLSSPTVWSPRNNPRLTRCRKMATLPAGYILQPKLPSASSSGKLYSKTGWMNYLYPIAHIVGPSVESGEMIMPA